MMTMTTMMMWVAGDDEVYDDQALGRPEMLAAAGAGRLGAWHGVALALA